ncbi:MAG: metallophosphoesterase family protein [Treponema sp.]|nr:metallophosphoesterase family protein [Treponema sp.]
MHFLVLSDIHGNLEVLDKLDDCFNKADAVLFAGDFARFEHEETGLPVLEKLCSKHDTIFSVLGNCDNPEFIADIESKDISVQKSLANNEGLSFLGSGGGSKFTGTTPFERTDEELVSDLALIKEQGEQEWNNLIVLMHNPPKDIKCDTISNGAHVGSPLLREFIENYKPLAVITGHIHESAGIDTIGNTTIINPGALLEGNYAWLDIEKQDGTFKVVKATLEHVK